MKRIKSKCFPWACYAAVPLLVFIGLVLICSSASEAPCDKQFVLWIKLTFRGVCDLWITNKKKTFPSTAARGWVRGARGAAQMQGCPIPRLSGYLDTQTSWKCDANDIPAECFDFQVGSIWHIENLAKEEKWHRGRESAEIEEMETESKGAEDM